MDSLVFILDKYTSTGISGVQIAKLDYMYFPECKFARDVKIVIK